jgi:excisionase family DNA binding protein
MLASKEVNMSREDERLTTKQVADELQVNKETVLRWLRRGELDGVDMGHRIGYRVRRSDMERFIGQRGKEAA